MRLTTAERSRRHNLKHPNSASERSKRWRERHPEKVNEWVNTNKEHRAQWLKNYRKKNWNKIFDIQKRSRKKHISRRRQENARWAARNPEKIVAQGKLNQAVKKGIIIRPEICQHCGKKSKIDAHHHKGYEHPLEVLWLCRQCHVDQHPRTIT